MLRLITRLRIYAQSGEKHGHFAYCQLWVSWRPGSVPMRSSPFWYLMNGMIISANLFSQILLKMNHLYSKTYACYVNIYQLVCVRNRMNLQVWYLMAVIFVDF